jgi:3-hydroxybutyryl-CoA dehydrogenase
MALPEHVGIYGGGRMGSGIAHAFLVRGSSVTVVEADEAAASGARDRIEAGLAKAQQRSVLDEEPSVVLDRLRTGADAAAIASAELVIEAVPEDVELKRRVLQRVAAAAPDAALATNTSSLSVDAIADGVPDATRLIGLHFFNPVPASDLVEIVVGPRTAEQLVADAQGWVAAIGKTAITVTDSPGFASSRLGLAIGLEAMRMLEDGVASAEDIDMAMTLGYKHPTGPLRTSDLVGLDVRLAIAEHLERELGERFAPPAILRDKVERGHLGRKTGQGFFTW